MADYISPVIPVLRGILEGYRKVPRYGFGDAYCKRCGRVVKPIGNRCPFCNHYVRLKPRKLGKHKTKPRIDPDKYLR